MALNKHPTAKLRIGAREGECLSDPSLAREDCPGRNTGGSSQFRGDIDVRYPTTPHTPLLRT